jgi:hypothetical protein
MKLVASIGSVCARSNAAPNFLLVGAIGSASDAGKVGNHCTNEPLMWSPRTELMRRWVGPKHGLKIELAMK